MNHDDPNPLIWDAATKASTRALLTRSRPSINATNDANDAPNTNNGDPGNNLPARRNKQMPKAGGFFNPQTLSPEYDEPEWIEFDPEPLTPAATNPQYIPTVKGTPIWERLPGEPLPFYEAFTRFRDQKPPRLTRQVATDLRGDPEVVHILSELWYWIPRATAYDHYEKALIERTRAQKIVVMESEHSTIARKLLAKAQDALANITEADLTPALALELIKTGTSLERLANRLPANAPTPEPKDTTPQVDIKDSQVVVNFVEDWRSN